MDMTTQDRVKQAKDALVKVLNEEIRELTTQRDLLLNGTGQKKPARRTLSASGRKSIAEAQRKRWAEQKRKQRNAGKKEVK